MRRLPYPFSPPPSPTSCSPSRPGAPQRAPPPPVARVVAAMANLGVLGASLCTATGGCAVSAPLYSGSRRASTSVRCPSLLARASAPAGRTSRSAPTATGASAPVSGLWPLQRNPVGAVARAAPSSRLLCGGSRGRVVAAATDPAAPPPPAPAAGGADLLVGKVQKVPVSPLGAL